MSTGMGGMAAPENRVRAADLRLTVLRIYYWTTPAFFLLDAVWGVSVRASFLPSADLRAAYYAFCLACALVCHWRPRLTPVIGIGESAASLLLLCLGVMLPIWNVSDAVLAGATPPAPLGPARLVNILLSGSMLVLSFHRNQALVLERAGLKHRRTGVDMV